VWRLPAQEHRAVLVVGALLIPGANGLVALDQTSLPSGLTALLGSAAPVWVVLLRTAGGERPSRLTRTAVVLGLAGTALLTVPGGTSGPSGAGGLLVLGGSLLWGLGSWLSSRLPLPRDPFVAAGHQMLLGGVLSAALGLGLGEGHGLSLGAVPAQAWIALAWLTVAGSLVGYTAYVWALSAAPPSLVSTTSYVTPVVAVALGSAVLGERLGTAALLGGAVVLVSCALLVIGETGGAADGGPRRQRRHRPHHAGRRAVRRPAHDAGSPGGSRAPGP
jgi:drug/metabolite transporter (DMT)-like permease